MTRPYWERDRPTVHERLRAHARHIGADRAAATDATAHLQYELLRHFLTLAETAMADENLDPATAQRVLDRLIYGCTPNPVEADERQRIIRQLAEQARWRPLVIRPDQHLPGGTTRKEPT